MDRRTEIQKILDEEVARWSEMSAVQLVNNLAEEKCYLIESNGKRYQIEVELLENKSDYVHVIVAVDDGRVPYSISPVCQSFIQTKAQQGPAN